MNKNYKFQWLLFFLTFPFWANSQTISYNTVTQGTGTVYGNNGQNGITFVIENTNSFPAILTEVGNYFTGTGSSSVELWYSATSLSGTTPAVSVANGWTQISTNTVTINNAAPLNANVGTLNTLFSGLSFMIPASTTYRFWLGSSVGLEYTGLANPTGAVPITFSNTGVNLHIGEYQIAGQFVGYGGPATGLTFNPRAFTGSVTLNLLSSPCSGVPNAGTTSANPTNPCPGTPVNLTLTGSTVAANLFFQWWRSTSPTGPWVPIPGSNAQTINYTPPAGSTTYYCCVVTCQNSGGLDTSTVAGPVVVQPFSPTSPCYCTSAATSTADEEITNVTIGSMNNTTTCANLNGTACTGTGTVNLYTDFTSCTPYPILYKGLAQTANLTVSTCSGFNYTSAFKIYIDYNQNTVFTDPGEEVYFSGTTGVSCLPPTTVNATFTVPITALSGPTRMRVINMENGHLSTTAITPCGTYAWGETEDYVVNIVQPSPYDPAVSSINVPTGSCFSANETVTVNVTNYGANTINLTTNPVTCTLKVNGPLGLVTYTGTLNTGTLNAYGATSQTLTFNNVNMFDGGNYCINTSLTVGNAGGVVNGSLLNDSLSSAVCRTNLRPTAGPDYELCQYNSIPFGQGLTVSGCAAPVTDSIEIIFTGSLPTIDNVGATTTGTSLVGANCQNQFAGLAGTATIPTTLPSNAYFTQNAKLTVTNLTSGYPTECRFILYGATPNGASLYSPCPTGYNTGAGQITVGGVATVTGGAFPNTEFFYTREILPAQLATIFSNAGSVLNVGYWETWNDFQNLSDIGANFPGVSQVKLKVYYNYVPATIDWYTVPTGGTSIYNTTPFNPLTTPGSGITNSNTVGTTTFYAACAGATNCRVPVDLNINPTPQAFQDTLTACEFAPSSNGAIFDLTTMNGAVSGNNAAASVDYYFDDALVTQILNPTNDTSSTNFIYSKVYYAATGCYSTDSLYLVVNTLPDFTAGFLTGSACAPNVLDVASLINPFSTVPPGSDTLYYEDPAYSIPHPNPHSIGQSDTVYMVIVTNSTPACSDSAIAIVDVQGGTNHIVAQDVNLNFSYCGNVGNNIMAFTDGTGDTIRSSADCKKVAVIFDEPDGTDLGSVSVLEDIACQTPFHNGQPYVNRAYTITPTNNDSAYVCLYYLDDDFALYNADASLTGWPLLPTASNMSLMSNMCITKVDGGTVGQSGTTAISIPNNQLNISYDASTTVWTVCFPVSGFSSFYCHTCNMMNAPLPVSLLSFKGQRRGQQSDLTWLTSQEINNSHFIVERSRDGKSFSALSDKIPSKGLNGNSQSILNYGYTDAYPINGHNYYRLHQEDLDGKVSYSQVVDVYFGNETQVSLYPNPVQNQLSLEVNTPKATQAELKILDATGRLVKVVSLSLTEGLNTTQVSMEGLADGMYMIRLSNDKGLNYSQIVRKN